MILLFLFFLSGFSGLVYQVLWFRLLALVFGVTVYSATTVLASFMSGLAIGSFVADKLMLKIKRPGLWFGIVEISIGVTALFTPQALQFLERIYMLIQPTLFSQFVLSFVVLLIPTTLMGASLPLVVKSVRNPSLAYALNTTGAIIGAALTGFYLIGNVGIHRSFLLAASINLFVGIVAVWWTLKQKK